MVEGHHHYPATLFGTGLTHKRTADSQVCNKGVPKGVKDGHPCNRHEAVPGMACPQGIEGSGMAGPGETLGSPLLPLAIRLWQQIKILKD
jgi:hypothetical protein